MLSNKKCITTIYIIPISQNNNSYLLYVNIDIFNELFIMGCFLLGIRAIITVFMNNNSRFNVQIPYDLENESDSPRHDLTRRLLAQLLHNNDNNTQPRTYVSFPLGHPGHLDLERRIRFVSIIRSSHLADNYRFGSSFGSLYVKNTYRYPTVTPEMVGVVLRAES